MLVVPGLELANPALQGANVDWQQGVPEPDAERSKHPFDFAIERWLANFAFKHRDTVKCRLKLTFELTAVIGDDEPRFAD